ncbi:unnamed protein product [Didymodactylos carnosus]|uniref:Kinesin motor domain-containing protein n=1 Tax=Didymodactylos carnosus TaxID=1234261 RepID=A0A814CC43_9BILA|nr:unnamed protein product [Didymodactylos carnosus]CAF0940503.1 unnamed protein product [Didymodactylos carnosus]CAF3559025.1 unnamed protein product [Didymodactylos carnosus]CAF3717070.1 unnamed protein product [Didymodactylos carnosus]
MIEQLNQQQLSSSLMQSPLLVINNDVNLSSLSSTTITKTDVFNNTDTRIYDNNNKESLSQLQLLPIPSTLSKRMIKINTTNTSWIKIGIRLWTPLIHDSIHFSSTSFIKVDKLQRQITLSDPKNNKLNSNSNNSSNSSKTFTFDQIFTPEESNLDISGKILIELISTLINGKNSTFICVGPCIEANYHCLFGNLFKKFSSSISVEQTGLLLCAITWLFHLIKDQRHTKIVLRLSAQEFRDKKTTNVRDLLKNEDQNNKTTPNIHHQQVPSEHVITNYVNAAKLINRAFENLSHNDDFSNTLIITIHLYKHNDDHDNNHSCLHFICLGHISEITTHFGNTVMATANRQKHMSLFNNRDHHYSTHFLTDYISDCHRLWLLANINVTTCQKTDILHTLQIMSKLHRTFKRTMKHKTKIHNDYIPSKPLLRRNSDPDCSSNSGSTETVVYCGQPSNGAYSSAPLEHLTKYMETLSSKPPGEVWVDGPLSAKKRSTQNEIWIDGPYEFRSASIRTEQNDTANWKPMHTKAKVIDSASIDNEKMCNTGDVTRSSPSNGHIVSNGTFLRQRLLNDQLSFSSTPASPILLSPKRGISPFAKLTSNSNYKIPSTHLQLGCLKSHEQMTSFPYCGSPMFHQKQTVDDITDDGCSTCSESVISSRCHVPQLVPLEKDPLLPFRCSTKLSSSMTCSISPVKEREDPCIQKTDTGDKQGTSDNSASTRAIISGGHTLPSSYRSQRQELLTPAITIPTTSVESTSPVISALVGSFYAPSATPYQGLLMPYSSQTLPSRHLTTSTKSIDDDMELLQKTLEILIVDRNDEQSLTRSLQSVELTPAVDTIDSACRMRTKQLVEIMSKEEKTKRLSRIVSPNRLERLQLAISQVGSVPNSPAPKAKQYAMSSTPGTPQILHLAFEQSNNQLQRSKRSKKPKTPARTTSLTPSQSILRHSPTDTVFKQTDLPLSPQKLLNKKSDSSTTTNRLTILQRLFGMKDATTNTMKDVPQSPKLVPKAKTPNSTRRSTTMNEDVLNHHPLTHTCLTLDLQNILPLSSTLSSGRASSSGYESMNNRDSGSGSSHNDSAEDSSCKMRSKSARKSDEKRSNNTNLPIRSPRLNSTNGIRISKAHEHVKQQQSQPNRLQSLQHRQNE